jgi:hypothetical protein
MQPTTIAQILTGFNTYNINSAITTMTAFAIEEGMDAQEAYEYMAETLQREFPEANSQSIYGALDRALQAANAARKLSGGSFIGYKDIPIVPGICVESENQESCRFVVSLHVCIHYPDGHEEWQTATITTDTFPTPRVIADFVQEMYETGRGLVSLPAGSGNELFAQAYCGYEIMAIYRSY